MDDSEVSQELVSDDEKRQVLELLQRKMATRLGLNPDLLGKKISFGLNSTMSPDQEHELAKAKGLQLALPAMEEVLPQIRTRDQLNKLVQSWNAAMNPAPTIARNLIQRIKNAMPRRGGPGRDSLLNDTETKMVCKEILKRVGKKYTATKAIAEVSKMSPQLIGKTVSTGTLWKAWKARDDYDLE